MKKIVISLLLLSFFVTTVNAKQFSSKEVLIQDVIKDYYNISYDSWMDMEYKDLSDVLYLESNQSYNTITSLKECILRWQILAQQDDYVDDRKKLDIIYNFGEITETDNVVTISVEIVGDKSQAYPYFVYFGENIFTLIESEGKWKITKHEAENLDLETYSPLTIVTFNPEKVYNEFKYISSKSSNVFSYSGDVGMLADPYTSYSYNAARAVAYANKFYLNRNTYFYQVTNNDCTNFISQCVSYGFGSTTGYSTATSYRMISTSSYATGWYAGGGGGSNSWETVEPHWTYMTSAKTNQEGPRVSIISYSSLGIGDVMQIDFDQNGSYTHTVICVAAGSNPKFAQHTVNAYRYYADYSGNKRFYRPTSFRVY